MDVEYLTGFEDTYTLSDFLGSGQFADVIRGTHKVEKATYVIKIILKENLETEYDEAALKEEIEVLHLLHHPNIIQFFSVYNEVDAYYLVTELVEGGELLDRLEYKEVYTEKEARDFCRILLQAIRHCHCENVVHRDIKPNNLLLLSQEDDSSIKVADFGFAKRLSSSTKYLKTQCGTLDYSAPEILAGKQYDTKVSERIYTNDMHEGDNKQDDTRRKEQIIAGKYHFHEDDWDGVSNSAKDLIRCLMNTRPNKRINAEDALQHPWILASDEELYFRDLGRSLDKLKTFNMNRKLKAAVQVVMIANKSSRSLP